MVSLCACQRRLRLAEEAYRVVCDDCGKTLVITHLEMVRLAKECQVTARCRKDCEDGCKETEPLR